MEYRPFLCRRVASFVAALMLFASGPLFAAADAPSLQTLQARLSERIPGFPKLDEVRASEMPGVYELRAGHSIYYSDALGDFVLRGDLIETRGARNLTQQRLEQLSAVDFGKLPLKDALVWKVGNGKRRIAVFADPNCPFCRKLEGELQNIKDATVYTFLYPALGEGSEEKVRNILCARNPQQTWRDWMVKGVAVPSAPACATAMERNSAFAREYRINGVPTLFFEDGTRAPGFMSLPQIEAKLAGDNLAKDLVKTTP